MGTQYPKRVGKLVEDHALLVKELWKKSRIHP